MSSTYKDHKKLLKKFQDQWETVLTTCVMLFVLTTVLSISVTILITNTAKYKVLGNYTPRLDYVAKYTEYDRYPINNPNDFNRNCFIDETNSDSYNVNECISAMEYFYEQTGIQSYFVIIDISEADISSDEEAAQYMEERVKTLIEDPYAIIHFECNTKEIDGSYYTTDDKWLFGNKTTTILNEDGRQIVMNNARVPMWCEWSESNPYMICAECVVDTLMNYHPRSIYKEFRWDILAIMLSISYICIAFYMFISSKIIDRRVKKVEDVISKHSIPNDEIDHWVEKYIKDQMKDTITKL